MTAVAERLAFQRLDRPEDVEATWRAFGQAIGIDALRRAYGPAWPRAVAPGEAVWRVLDGWETAAWLSIRVDPVEPWAWYAAGVWPAWQRRGIVHELRAWSLTWLRAWPDLRGLLIEVLDTNAGYQQALRREVDRGGSLRLAGRIEVPGSEAQLFWLEARG